MVSRGNGRHDQVFFNSTGIVWKDAPEPDFGDIDSGLYAIDEQAIREKLIDHIRNNKESFYFDGNIITAMA